MVRNSEKSSKPTVALLCTTLNQLGGLSQHILQFYQNIDRSKFRVIIIYFSFQHITVEKFFLDHGVRPEDLHYVNVSKSNIYLFGILYISMILRKEKVDLIHSFLLHSDVLGYFAAKLGGVKALISQVDGKFYLDQTNGVGSFKQKCYRFFNRLIRKNFNKTITVSRSLRSEVVLAGASEDKVVVNPVGIKTPSERPINEVQKSVESSPIIACMSRFSPDKGIHYFIDAIPKIYEELPTARFIIAGRGEEEVKLRRQVSELNLQKLVTFLDWVEDIEAFFVNVDVFVMPSLREGCPIGLLEALSFAKPSVAFRVEGISEVLENERGGLLVDPFDTKQFASAVVRLCQDRDFAYQVAKRGQEHVLKENSIEREINQTMQEYSQALGIQN